MSNYVFVDKTELNPALVKKEKNHNLLQVNAKTVL
jgi:hypothetical protein